jgi:hypothetical protein
LLLLLLATVLVALLAACGSGTSTTNTGFNLDGGTDGRGGHDSSAGHKDGGIRLGNGDTGGGCGLVTCASKHANCGPISDGCGNIIECGSCTAPQTCGGGGPNVCGVPDGSTCVSKTCSQLEFNCGPQGDGCGNVIQCGSCTGTDICGGGGKPGVCGTPPDGGLCTPNTCSSLHANCGAQSNGCGGMLDCGSCSDTQTCGGGGTANQCGSVACVPTTCAKLGFNCGAQSDGCGGMLECGTCTGADTCGGGGKPSVCGHSDASTCTPTTCAALGVGCGTTGDGCGGMLMCGTCPTPQTCGGAGTPNQCGSACVPNTCTGLGVNCGPAGDGCGGTLMCGTCSGSQTCGGGGVAGVCGSPACTPLTCAGLGKNCGPVGDGCGNILNCGTCTSPNTCGGDGVANVCGAKPCVPKTCSDLGLDCGPASNGCGGTLQCGSCSAPQACGGSGKPGVCGCTGECSFLPTCTAPATTTLSGFVYDPADLHPLYDILVYIPNNPTDPGLTSPFPEGVTCDQCGSTSSVPGQPLVVANTAPNGSFTLSDVPVGASVPLVIQSGHWRRQFTVNIANSCGSNTISTANTTPVKWLSATQPSLAASGHLTFPSTSKLGDIPYIAILTGGWDPIECVLRKMGVADSEFVNPGGAGHIQFYLAAQPNAPSNQEGDPFYPYTSQCPPNPYGSGAQISASTPSQAALFAGTGGPGGAPEINNYDLTILACEGYEEQEQAYWSNLGTYTGLGGRVFATDFGYDWLAATHTCPTGTGCPAGTSCENDDVCVGANNTTQNPAFPNVATWDTFSSTNAVDGTAQTASVDLVSNPKGAAFQSWLQDVGIVAAGADMTTKPLNPVYQATTGIIAPTQQQLYWGAEVPIEFTFNTPVNATATNQCGRVNFMDWHADQLSYQPLSNFPSCPFVYNEPQPAPYYSHGMTFPKECDSNPMTGQEAVVEFMLFDVTSCVTPYQASCVSLTCTEQGITCGPAGDGCGNLIPSCGTCTAPQTCGGGGSPGVCGSSQCVPGTCASEGFNCGQQGDGCGGTLSCGTCTAPQDCGGGGTPGVCGGLACVPKTCAELGFNCGPAGDGCGGLLQCGTCTGNETCGGGGTGGVCGNSCIPTTCAKLGYDCGTAGDGCGGVLNCGMCTTPQTCGGGGTPSVCGQGMTCTPETCAQLGFNCGTAGNGCGGSLNCGTCTGSQTCGGGGHPGVCGSPSCTPATCMSLGINCGPAGDGCGNQLNCGNCTAPETCGGGGKPGICGAPGCTPSTCAAEGFNCGQEGDGCGNLLNCGTCMAPETCGGGGQAGVCGSTACTPETCASQGYNCGEAGNGCGGTINCGACTSPQTCGGGGQANVCGSPK